jgi:hypothetical protein
MCQSPKDITLTITRHHVQRFAGTLGCRALMDGCLLKMKRDALKDPLLPDWRRALNTLRGVPKKAKYDFKVNPDDRLKLVN